MLFLGKNLTVKTVKKKQKHKNKGNVRTITKQVRYHFYADSLCLGDLSAYRVFDPIFELSLHSILEPSYQGCGAATKKLGAVSAPAL